MHIESKHYKEGRNDDGGGGETREGKTTTCVRLPVSFSVLWYTRIVSGLLERPIQQGPSRRDGLNMMPNHSEKSNRKESRADKESCSSGRDPFSFKPVQKAPELTEAQENE